MAKLIVYKEPSGNLCILTPAPKDRVGLLLPQVLGMTDDEYLAFITAKDVPAGATDVQLIDSADFPAERGNRDCWDIANGKVEVHAGKLQAKQAAKAAKQAKQGAVLSKLKISAAELKDLLENA